MTSNQATLGWNSVNGGSSYSVRYKPTGTGTWLGPIITNTPGIVLTGLNSETLYDWNVSATCNNGNASANAPQKQFTTYSSNCMSYGVNTAEWIDFFSLGTISRISGAEIGGYYKSSLATDLVIGSAGNTVAISPGFTAGVTIGEYYAVYIDYNRNGSFADAGETVVAPVLWTGSSSTANHTSTFTVSSNAVAGPAKMRVILRRAGSSINPCNTGFFGETEDYDITLVAAVNNLVNETGNKSITDFTKTEKNTPALTISPNPSDGLFIVEVPDSFKGEKYEILNMTGTIMQQGKLHGINRFNINIDSKAKGAYYLTVYDVKLKKLSAKLIVQ